MSIMGDELGQLDFIPVSLLPPPAPLLLYTPGSELPKYRREQLDIVQLCTTQMVIGQVVRQLRPKLDPGSQK